MATREGCTSSKLLALTVRKSSVRLAATGDRPPSCVFGHAFVLCVDLFAEGASRLGFFVALASGKIPDGPRLHRRKRCRLCFLFTEQASGCDYLKNAGMSASIVA